MGVRIACSASVQSAPDALPSLCVGLVLNGTGTLGASPSHNVIPHPDKAGGVRSL